jgi:hypothetical protein
VVVGALVLAFVLGAGVGAIVGRNPTGRSAPSAGQAPATGGRGGSTGPTAPADPDQSLLAQVVIQPSDVTPPQGVALLPGGDQVAGETTLDLCNGVYPSESSRSARLQVAEGNSQGDVVLSTEAVLYRTAADTSQAFAELHKVAAACPNAPVPSTTGGPTVQTTFNPPSDGGWPQTPKVERVAYDFVTTDERGQTQHVIAVYLRRGRALVGVYFSQPDGPQAPVAGKTSVPEIVGVFASRLAKLPDAAVNKTVPGGTFSSFAPGSNQRRSGTPVSYQVGERKSGP